MLSSLEETKTASLSFMINFILSIAVSHIVEVAEDTLHFLLAFTAELGRRGCLLLHCLDDSSGHCLPHVLQSKTAGRRKEEWGFCKVTLKEKGSLASVRGASLPRTQQPPVPGSPRGGNSEKVSTHMAWLGTICTMAASGTWGCPPASCLSAGQSFPSVQQACRRRGPCGSPAPAWIYPG